MLIQFPLPVLGFSALSGVGKTTLLCRLVPQLRASGLRVAIIKHAHHEFDTDIPGKDSYELRRAGAAQMLIASRNRQALITETPGGPEPRLADLLLQLDHRSLDLVLVEGFKKEPIPKIELHRPRLGHPLLCLNDEFIIALATDESVTTGVKIPVLDLNQPEQITDFILKFFNRSVSKEPAHL